MIYDTASLHEYRFLDICTTYVYVYSCLSFQIQIFLCKFCILAVLRKLFAECSLEDSAQIC